MALYAIWCEGGFAKIGVTKNPHTRVGQMQGGCPHRLSLLGAFEVPPARVCDVEHKAMLALDDYHHFGDWFRCSEADALHAIEQAALKVGGKPWFTARSLHYNYMGYRSVKTPKGIFARTGLAAKAHGITRVAAIYRAKRQIMGWSYIDSP